MSTTLAEGPTATQTSPARPRAGRVWSRVALACALLAAAGAVRLYQGRQVDVLMKKGEKPAFPLSQIAKELPPWHVAYESTLPPEIARGAGSVDSVNRYYVDGRTGVPITALVLYGRALVMRDHAPQVCYPASGHVALDEPVRRTIEYTRPDGTPGKAQFLAQVFARGDGATAQRHMVYHSWYYNDHWTPDTAGPKQFQRVPGMYKLHVDRVAVPGEVPGDKDPCESLLRVLVPEMERHLAANAPPHDPRATPSPAAAQAP